jgi:hypothetical protein
VVQHFAQRAGSVGGARCPCAVSRKSDNPAFSTRTVLAVNAVHGLVRERGHCTVQIHPPRPMSSKVRVDVEQERIARNVEQTTQNGQVQSS